MKLPSRNTMAAIAKSQKLGLPQGLSDTEMWHAIMKGPATDRQILELAEILNSDNLAQFVGFTFGKAKLAIERARTELNRQAIIQMGLAVGQVWHVVALGWGGYARVEFIQDRRQNTVKLRRVFVKREPGALTATIMPTDVTIVVHPHRMHLLARSVDLVTWQPGDDSWQLIELDENNEANPL